MVVEGRDDFASASLVALVIKAVGTSDPALLPPDARAPDPMKDVRLSALAKRQLLKHIYEKGGAGPLLDIARHLDGTSSPVLSVLATAARPEIFIDKWMRLEKYGHAANRTDIRLDENSLHCSRYSLQKTEPTPAENALIAGLFFGLCRLAGAQALTLEIDGLTLDAHNLHTAGTFNQSGAHFLLRWQTWTPHKDAFTEIAESADTLSRLKALFASDTAHCWTIAEAARKLAKSSRSLQRELASAGVTFSSALRGERVSAAARMLREGPTSLAETAYCCGYADQPHFQRDFRRATNMSPGEYRLVARR